ncbi:MAG TPA: ABC transporter ATP-binding protein [Candidatus Krumholzibacteria bacterium]|nr:ABC transporter ATP-binding protein [Candidatus Krumholzibacteria bacterium]
MTAVLRASDLSKTFGRLPSQVEVLRGASLEIERGELVAVAGSSGSGKSTLLHILGGLMHPDAGRVELGGEDLYALGDRQRAHRRSRRVGFVFQMHHLLPEFTALENVVLPALIAKERETTARARALELLEAMGIAGRARHKPGELSGGEQQRVAVARALVNMPEVVLADEPSGNLDRDSSEALLRLLEQLSRERHQAFLVATHSPSLARRAQRTLVLSEGVLRPLQQLETVL